MSTVHTRNSLIGDEPRVALLSFSTKGSAEHELVQKVRSAKAILDERKADFIYDGELQLDAAIVESVASRKARAAQWMAKPISDIPRSSGWKHWL
jgi:phosphate acetyltransferase